MPGTYLPQATRLQLIIHRSPDKATRLLETVSIHHNDDLGHWICGEEFLHVWATWQRAGPPGRIA